MPKEEHLQEGHQPSRNEQAGHQPTQKGDLIKGHQPGGAPTNQGKPPSGGSGVKPPKKD